MDDCSEGRWTQEKKIETCVDPYHRLFCPSSPYFKKYKKYLESHSLFKIFFFEPPMASEWVTLLDVECASFSPLLAFIIEQGDK